MKKRRYKFWSSIITIALLILPVVLVGFVSQRDKVALAQEKEHQIKQLMEEKEVLQAKVIEYDSLETPTQDQEVILAEIKRVFGKYTPKALLLLRGDGKGGCTENWHLNPKASNTNKDGSKDYGVFQINNYWHGFKTNQKNIQMLSDYKVNIAMAYRLFEDSGYRFNLWTCGKYYGI